MIAFIHFYFGPFKTGWPEREGNYTRLFHVMIVCANTNTGEGCYYGIILSDTEACALLLSFIVWMLLVVFCCATFVENEIPNFLIRIIRPFTVVPSSVIMCISDLISPKQAVIVTAKLSGRHQSLGRSIIRMVH